MMRLFVAIELTPRMRKRVAQALEDVRAKSPDSKWVAAENLHVTLVFLGNVPDERVPELIAALDDVASRHGPFSVRVGGGGSFGSKRRPRVLWVGVQGGVQRLTRVFADVEEAMTAFGYTPEARPYHPHVTLARARDPRGDPGLAECANALQALALTTMHLSHVSLVKSTPGRGGSKYVVIHRAVLRHA